MMAEHLDESGVSFTSSHPHRMTTTATATLFWKFLAIALLVKELHRLVGLRHEQQRPIDNASLLLLDTVGAKKDGPIKNNIKSTNEPLDDQQQQSLFIPHSAWCPQTPCGGNGGTPVSSDDKNATESCALCDQRFLILLAIGRSASTTLTWTLDALPGLRMGGENNGVINQLYDLVQGTALDAKYQRGNGRRNAPWGHGNVTTTMTDLYCAAQDFVRALYPVYPSSSLNDVIGFKTVRLLRNHSADRDPDYVRFLTTLFPCARFVINIRSDLDALRASQHAAFGPNMIVAVDETERLVQMADQLGADRAYVLDSTEWTKNVTVLNELVRWLGYDDACAFADVLELNTVQSYKNGKEQFTHALPSQCRYSLSDRDSS